MKTKTRKPLTPIFVNAEEMARDYPKSFFVPEARHRIRNGDAVKVCCGGERFWTIVKSVKDGIITAEVNNVLVCEENEALELGTLIQFAPCNVYQVMRGQEYLE